MTNETLLRRAQALQQAAGRVQTTRMRYAIQKNLRATEALLEPYHETLRQIAQDYGLESFEEPPEAAQTELEALLAEDAGEPEVDTVPPGVLTREDERGTELEMEVVAGLDFMIER